MGVCRRQAGDLQGVFGAVIFDQWPKQKARRGWPEVGDSNLPNRKHRIASGGSAEHQLPQIDGVGGPEYRAVGDGDDKKNGFVAPFRWRRGANHDIVFRPIAHGANRLSEFKIIWKLD